MSTPPGNDPPDTEATLDMLRTFVEEQRTFNDELRGFIKRSDTRYQTLSAGLGVLKGGYAINTALSNATQIAVELGFQLVALMPKEELDAFADLVATAGEPPADVDSFRNADIVMLARGSGGHALYIAAEVSYTVDSHDVHRSKRNADYLSRVIQLPTRGAVIGVVMPETVRHLADDNGVLRYLIRPT